MKKTMLDTTMRLIEETGYIPSVPDVAEAAEVSRATAYRYFPSQAALIQAAVEEALGPILGWTSDAPDVEARTSELLAFAYPRMEKYEATLRAALWLSLDHWRRRQAGTIGGDESIVRGHRRGLLAKALAPLEGRLDRKSLDRLKQAVSLVFGTEAIVVLKDIWRLDDEETKDVAIWTANALVRAALAEARAPAKKTAGKKAPGKKAPGIRKVATRRRRKGAAPTH
jgi:AcrR family transcriptional regulator